MTTALEQVSTSGLVDTNDGARSVSPGRRRWPEDVKRRMVLESQEPGASVSVVARRYDVNANQLFKWRRDYEASLAGSRSTTGIRLVPVELRPAASAASASGTIEIELVGGARVRAIGAVDAGLLGRVLSALR